MKSMSQVKWIAFVVIFLIVGEVGLRHTDWIDQALGYDHKLFIENDFLSYSFRPGYTGWVGKDEYKINSWGFREREWERKKGYRIAILGDSVTAGFGVDVEFSYPKVLERLLGYEVLNFGVNGYNTEQEVVLWDKWVEHFLPDLTIVGYVNNDSRERYKIQDGYLCRDKGIKSYVFALFKRSVFNVLLSLGVSSKFNSEYILQEEEKHYRDPVELLDIDNLLVVVFPYCGQKKINPRLTMYLETNNIRYIDMVLHFNRRYPEGFDNLFRDHAHLSMKGNLIVAEILRDYLKELLNEV